MFVSFKTVVVWINIFTPRFENRQVTFNIYFWFVSRGRIPIGSLAVSPRHVYTSNESYFSFIAFPFKLNSHRPFMCFIHAVHSVASLRFVSIELS